MIQERINQTLTKTETIAGIEIHGIAFGALLFFILSFLNNFFFEIRFFSFGLLVAIALFLYSMRQIDERAFSVLWTALRFAIRTKNATCFTPSRRVR